MDTYFFVPGNRLIKIDSVKKLHPTEIIIDLEDAVKGTDRLEIINSLTEVENFLEHYIRVPLYEFITNQIDISILEKLIQFGFKKFVFPKIKSLEDFEKIFNSVSNKKIKIILLVESPQLFFEAKDILLKYRKFISAIGMGSHDFMSEVGGEHSLENLEYLRQNILYLARMVNIIPIDIASMELNNEEVFKDEVKDGFKKGYDAKFIIHPWQLDLLKEIKFYTKQDYIWAEKIVSKLGEVLNEDEFNPVVIDGEVIEKPHLKRAKRILNSYENES